MKITLDDIHPLDKLDCMVKSIRGLPGYHYINEKVYGPDGIMMTPKSSGRYLLYKDGAGIYQTLFQLKTRR